MHSCEWTTLCIEQKCGVWQKLFHNTSHHPPAAAYRLLFLHNVGGEPRRARGVAFFRLVYAPHGCGVNDVQVLCRVPVPCDIEHVDGVALIGMNQIF